MSHPILSRTKINHNDLLSFSKKGDIFYLFGRYMNSKRHVQAQIYAKNLVYIDV